MTKRKPKSQHKPSGRPTIINEKVIKRLEEVFSIGGTDLEACLYANIGKATLYKYQRGNPEFLDRKELLKEKTILKARREVDKGLKGNPDFSLKYLERKRKKEFGTQQNIDHTTGGKSFADIYKDLLKKLDNEENKND